MSHLPEPLPLINRLPAVPPERPLALAWLAKRYDFPSTAVASLIAELAFEVARPR